MVYFVLRAERRILTQEQHEGTEARRKQAEVPRVVSALV